MARRTFWTPDRIKAVLDLSAKGMTDAEVARATGVPKATVRAYRSGRLPRRAGPELTGIPECACCRGPVHDFTTLDAPTYTYLLGAYLGDGWITINALARRLNIALDLAWPGVIAEISAAIEAIRGRPPGIVKMKDGRNCLYLLSYWKQWPCYFPQHGPGRKHKRKIELAPWQQSLVDQAPGHFLRGLIHTDGWRGLNRVRVKGKDYEYPRYQFSNRSDDIRKLFTDTCDQLGIEWRQWTRWHISVARKDAVARLDEFVGLKY